LGYQVVEVVDDEVPMVSPQASRQEETLSSSPISYQVVEVTPAQQPPRDARAANRPPRRKCYPLLRRGALVATGSVLLLVTLVLLVGRLSTRARAAPPATMTVPSPQATALPPAPACTARAIELPHAPACAAPDDEKPGRETFATAVQFVRNPAEAGRMASRERKLLFLLHVSGNFEDSGFT
jgi:hypothetical protein